VGYSDFGGINYDKNATRCDLRDYRTIVPKIYFGRFGGTVNSFWDNGRELQPTTHNRYELCGCDAADFMLFKAKVELLLPDLRIVRAESYIRVFADNDVCYSYIGSGDTDLPILEGKSHFVDNITRFSDYNRNESPLEYFFWSLELKSNDSSNFDTLIFTIDEHVT
jgi:hypothetical protein